MDKFEIAHQRLVEACDSRSWRDDPENPDEPATIQAMQIALNLPKQEPPARTEVLEAAASAVVAVCLDERAGEDGAFAHALGQWYGHRIRKIARRARNKAWRDVQSLLGVTVADRARAFAPSAVGEVDPLIGTLTLLMMSQEPRLATSPSSTSTAASTCLPARPQRRWATVR